MLWEVDWQGVLWQTRAFEFFDHRLVFDRPSLTRWRTRTS
jgi:hypothetical protein